VGDHDGEQMELVRHSQPAERADGVVVCVDGQEQAAGGALELAGQRKMWVGEGDARLFFEPRRAQHERRVRWDDVDH
jgi:hypothetical protein